MHTQSHKPRRLHDTGVYMPWRREWQPTPVFVPGESHGQRSLGRLQSTGPQSVGHTWAANREAGGVHIHVNTNAYTLSFKHQGFRRVFPVSCKAFTWLYLHSFWGELAIICTIPPEFLHQAMFNILIQKVFQRVDRACFSPGSSGSLEQVSSSNGKSHLHLQSFPQPCITSLPKSSHRWQYLATDGWLLSQFIFSHWL